MAQLDALLAATEREARQPLVPENIRPWAGTVEARMIELDGAWRREATARVAAGGGQQPPHGKKLQVREARLGRGLESLRGRAQEVGLDAAKVSSGTEEVAEAAEDLRKEVLAWVLEARRHVAELRRWWSRADAATSRGPKEGKESR